MNYCINPRCTKRENLDNAVRCANCDTPLVVNGSYRLLRFLRNPNPDYNTELFEVSDASGSSRKKVLKSLIKDEALLCNLFAREQDLLINFEHPGIPRGEDFFSITIPSTEQSIPCLVMEWIGGENLLNWIEAGAIGEETALNWLEQLASILAYVHEKQVLHRDIKPSNIMRRPDGQLVLIDFGAVKSSIQTKIDGKNVTIVSSYGYTAPEQLQGKAVPQSDFFALGRTFVHLLTQKHPDDALSGHWWKDIQPPLSDALVTLINDLMRVSPQERPQNDQVLQQWIAAIKSRSSTPTIVRASDPVSPNNFRHWRWVRRWILWVSLFLLALCIGLVFHILRPSVNEPACNSVANDALSCGEELFTGYRSDAKMKGANEVINAYAEIKNGHSNAAFDSFKKAARIFESTLKYEPNDPEVKIYYNNAQIQADEAKGKLSYSIAVAVPLNGVAGGSNNRGIEMLRGIAQAQDEAYRDGFRLKILIGDDHNDGKEQAPKIANDFAARSDILAVIGHYASEVTEPSIPIYQKHGLVIISPTSTASSLTKEGSGNHVFFRTVPANSIESMALARHLSQEHHQKVAIFYNADPASRYSKTLADNFGSDFPHYFGGQVVKTFDTSKHDFNAEAAVKQSQTSGATALAVFPDGYTSANSFKNSLEVIRSSQGKFLVVGSNSLLDSATLHITSLESLQHLVLVVPWHGKESGHKAFVSSAQRYWGGGEVNWRSATSYDAVEVIIAALKKLPNANRQSLQQVLARDDFSTEGATGKISFEGCDRREKFHTLLKVVSTPHGQEFVPFSRDYSP
jgi:eukaryotic-like serine/threonine-protein kinase